MQKKNKSGNVLFVHNSVPEYRIEFWRELGNYYNLTLLITNKGLENKIYNLEKNEKGLNILYLEDINLYSYLSESFEYVVLSPVDSITEFVIDLLILRLSKKYRYKCVYWSEKWEADWNCQPVIKKAKNLIHRLLISTVAKRVDYCIAAGTKAEYYLKQIGINNCSVAIDSSTSPEIDGNIDIRTQFSIPKEKRIILFMGRLVSRKGCCLLIKALINELNNLNACLIIAGDGPEKELCEKLSNNNKNILLVGKVQPCNRRYFYEQSDVFVIPSICEKGVIEAWGLTVNEALECGLPVIATDIVGSAYDLINAKNGIVVKNNDEIELYNAVKRILSNDELYISERIKSCYEKYSVKNMAKSFAEILGDEI